LITIPAAGILPIAVLQSVVAFYFRTAEIGAIADVELVSKDKKSAVLMKKGVKIIAQHSAEPLKIESPKLAGCTIDCGTYPLSSAQKPAVSLHPRLGLGQKPAQ